MAALWRAYRTKHYGPHAKALRLRRVRAGQPEDPPPGSNRMIQRDAQVLKRWADKKAALARRAQLPTHETLLQQHARKRGWSQQRSDDKPCCSVHWSTRATLRTVQSHDIARANALRSPATGGGGGNLKRKSDKAVGDFALQWLRGVGACGWVQQRLVLLLQTTYRCALLLLLLHLACAHACIRPQLTLHLNCLRSHLARRLLAHVTRHTQGFARTRLRSPVKPRSSAAGGGAAAAASSVSDTDRAKVMHAYGGRKSVLYTMIHSDDSRPSTGSPGKAARGNRNERLGQLFAYAGKWRWWWWWWW